MGTDFLIANQIDNAVTQGARGIRPPSIGVNGYQSMELKWKYLLSQRKIEKISTCTWHFHLSDPFGAAVALVRCLHNNMSQKPVHNHVYYTLIVSCEQFVSKTHLSYALEYDYQLDYFFEIWLQGLQTCCWVID